VDILRFRLWGNDITSLSAQVKRPAKWEVRMWKGNLEKVVVGDAALEPACPPCGGHAGRQACHLVCVNHLDLSAVQPNQQSRAKSRKLSSGDRRQRTVLLPVRITSRWRVPWPTQVPGDRHLALDALMPSML
jgi:hypothetical protein